MELEEWDCGTGTTAYGRRNHLRRDGSDESLCGRELVSGPGWLDLCGRCDAILQTLPSTKRQVDLAILQREVDT